jgi:hypothetical protein
MPQLIFNKQIAYTGVADGAPKKSQPIIFIKVKN